MCLYSKFWNSRRFPESQFLLVLYFQYSCSKLIQRNEIFFLSVPPLVTWRSLLIQAAEETWSTPTSGQIAIIPIHVEQISGKRGDCYATPLRVSTLPPTCFISIIIQRIHTQPINIYAEVLRMGKHTIYWWKYPRCSTASPPIYGWHSLLVLQNGESPLLAFPAWITSMILFT